MPGGIWAMLMLLLAVLLVAYLVGLIFRDRSSGGGRDSCLDRLDSEAILKARFARGEIGEEEYHRMRRVLAQP